jgi:glycosyltransferase involved in cell wall biosynthesis
MIMNLFLNLLFLTPFLIIANQTPFVILIFSYNNEKWVDQNIHSALNQEYSNFRILYVDDASTDKTLEKLNQCLENHPRRGIVEVHSHSINRGAASNFYNYIHQNVLDDEVVVSLDGDDQLSNNGVLAYLDEVYSNPLRDIWITYGQYTFQSSGLVGSCVKRPYLFEKGNPPHLGYRKEEFRFSHLRTFKGWLFKKIRKKDLYYGEKFVHMASDTAIMWPMIEMASNGHFQFIDKILYIYNDLNVLSDHNRSRQAQTDVHGYVAKKAAYIPLD